MWKTKKKKKDKRPSTKPRPKPNAQKKKKKIGKKTTPTNTSGGCCLALTTDRRLYSSHCRQCCLGPVLAGWDACCCRCSVDLAGGSIRQRMSSRSCIPTRCLDTWRWAVPLHSMEGTWRRTCFQSVHSLDTTPRIVWLTGVPHNMSVLYTAGLPFRPCTERLNERARMGSFRRWHEMDALMRAMRRCTRWENTHLPHLSCAPLDLLNRHAMLYDKGPAYGLYRRHCHHVDAMAQLLSPPHWYVIGLS